MNELVFFVFHVFLPISSGSIANNDWSPAAVDRPIGICLPVPLPLRDATDAVLRDVVRPRSGDAETPRHYTRSQLSRHLGEGHAEVNEGVND